MANIQATAIKDGDHFVINGQKTWASRGAFAHWLFGMFRSDPDSTRHKGLTFILVPLDTPGITVRPIEKLNNKKAFAEVFFDDARVPVEYQLGEEGKGWDVAMATAGFERGLMLRSPARFQDTARKLVELYKETVASGAYVAPELRRTVAQCWMDAEAYALNTYQTVAHLIAGGKIGAEASLNKIFWSELDTKMHETALKLLGHRAELLGFVRRGRRRGVARRLHLRPRRPHLRRNQRDPAQHHRRAHSRHAAEVGREDDYDGIPIHRRPASPPGDRPRLPRRRVHRRLRARPVETETGRSPEFWASLAEIGVPGLLIPEEHGGLGMTEIDLVLVMVEVGRAGLAEPVTPTAPSPRRSCATAGTKPWPGSGSRRSPRARRSSPSPSRRARWFPRPSAPTS